MPLGKFGKMDVLRLNLRAFQSQNIYKGINLKKQINCEMKGSSLTINIITYKENIP